MNTYIVMDGSFEVYIVSMTHEQAVSLCDDGFLLVKIGNDGQVYNFYSDSYTLLTPASFNAFMEWE